LELEEEIKRQQELDAIQRKKAEIEAVRHEEKRRQEELQRQAMIQEIEATRRLIIQKENFVNRIEEENKKCTIAVQYSPATIIISWSLGDLIPTDKDWIGFYKRDNPDKSYKDYFTTKGQRQGNNFIRTPTTPGVYEFRFFPNGSYNKIASSDIIYIGPELELRGSFEDNSVIFSWNLKRGQITNGDWFGFYKQTSDNRNYIKTIPISTDKTQDTVRLDLRLDPGLYVFRFFPYKCGYTKVKESEPFEVPNLDSLDYEIVMDDNNRVEKIKVFYQINSRTASNSDWIAFYKKDSENNYYISYKYIDTRIPFVEFECPREITEYEFRYHSSTQSKYQDLTRSKLFIVENTDIITAQIDGRMITVSWDIHSQEKTTSDWIGLFNVNETNNKNYLQYKYIDTYSNAAIFTIPRERGQFEVRYFSYNLGRYNDFRKSNQIIVNF